MKDIIREFESSLKIQPRFFLKLGKVRLYHEMLLNLYSKVGLSENRMVSLRLQKSLAVMILFETKVNDKIKVYTL